VPGRLPGRACGRAACMPLPASRQPAPKPDGACTAPRQATAAGLVSGDFPASLRSAALPEAAAATSAGAAPARPAAHRGPLPPRRDRVRR
jgi:hypothetical protein